MQTALITTQSTFHGVTPTVFPTTTINVSLYSPLTDAKG